MVKKELEIKHTIGVKGIVESIGENSIEVLDEKTEVVDTVTLTELLGAFIGKSINLSITESTKRALKDEDFDDDEEEY